MFIFIAQTALVFKSLSTIKGQHRVADMAYEPCFEEREKRVATDIKRVLILDCYQSVTATALNKGVMGEDMQPQPAFVPTQDVHIV